MNSISLLHEQLCQTNSHGLYTRLYLSCSRCCIIPAELAGPDGEGGPVLGGPDDVGEIGISGNLIRNIKRTKSLLCTVCTYNMYC